MDALQQQITQAFEGKIDFEGQKLVDQIARIALGVIAVVAFLVGLALQSIQTTFIIFGAGTVLLLVAVVPPWPMFNQHPVQWLPAKAKSTNPSGS
ncbi:microsomal signal peptidase 12 kDa subunit [Trametopsis cervina]|nr:microsomal signal peptidase 12 kDa subunit [Trametopsis cervina]